MLGEKDVKPTAKVVETNIAPLRYFKPDGSEISCRQPSARIRDMKNNRSWWEAQEDTILTIGAVSGRISKVCDHNSRSL